MVPKRTRLLPLLVVVAVLVAAGIGIATYFVKGKTTTSGGQAGQVTPSPGKAGGTAATAGQEQEVAQNCLDVEPKPVRYKFNDKNFPTGKLGEWHEVTNEDGQTILRVKVELEDAAVYGTTGDYRTGKTAPGIRALFTLTLDNLTCHPFEWKVRHTQGMWLGVHPPGKDPWSSGETVGWIDSWRVSTYPAGGIMVAEDGKFVYPEEAQYRERFDKIFFERYGLAMPREFPDAFPPGETTGQFYIQLGDILGRTTFGAVGPNRDFHLPLVLGGYMGFAKIDLGKATDWFSEFFDGDPNDPKWLDHAQVSVENLNRKRKSQ